MTAFAFASNWAGSFIFNVLGDKYGRLYISKIGFILACTLYLFYLPPLIYPLVLTYMLLFGFLNAYFLQSYILGVEFTSSENRDFYTIVAQSFDGLMGTFTVVVFSLTKNFRVFMIASFTFGVVIMILMFLFVPESPRYYVATNQNKKALGVYKYLAKLHPK
jgi:MFS family permease